MHAKKLESRHTFFLFVGSLLDAQKLQEQAIITFIDKELAHRMYTILRLRPNEHVELFSKQVVVTFCLMPSPRPKDTVIGRIESATVIKNPTHQITAAIGLLKKESFEEAVHHATVTGATHIQPLITSKSRTGWLNEREAERLTAITIAACEQSKNKIIPMLLPPLPLAQFLEKNTAVPCRIGFESTSTQTLSHLITELAPKNAQTIEVFIGPEGGFTEEEITLMEKSNVTFYQLTPTILRSQEATCLAIGAITAGIITR